MKISTRLWIDAMAKITYYQSLEQSPHPIRWGAAVSPFPSFGLLLTDCTPGIGVYTVQADRHETSGPRPAPLGLLAAE